MHSSISSVLEGNRVKADFLIASKCKTRRKSEGKGLPAMSVTVKFKGGGVGWPLQPSILIPKI